MNREINTLDPILKKMSLLSAQMDFLAVVERSFQNSIN